LASDVVFVTSYGKRKHLEAGFRRLGAFTVAHPCQKHQKKLKALMLKTQNH